MYFGTSNATTTSATTSYPGMGTVRIFINAPPPPPPKCPDQLWVEKVLGQVFGPIDPRECARVRAAFAHFGFSPEVQFDPAQCKKDYRAMAKSTHPDIGGDEDEFKALSDAWDVLRRRGFV